MPYSKSSDSIEEFMFLQAEDVIILYGPWLISFNKWLTVMTQGLANVKKPNMAYSLARVMIKIMNNEKD